MITFAAGRHLAPGSNQVAVALYEASGAADGTFWLQQMSCVDRRSPRADDHSEQTL